MPRGVHSTQERQNREAFPRPKAGLVLGAFEIFETRMNVNGYAAIDLFFVTSAAGTVDVFESRACKALPTPGVFARTLAAVPTVATVNETGAVVFVLCRRIFTCGDLVLIRFTNGGFAQTFFDSDSKALPLT